MKRVLIGARELHDAANRSLGDAVQLVDMRRARRSVYSFVGEQFSELFERNSPALSLCNVPTTRVGVSRPLFRRAVKPARKLRMCLGASCLLRIKCTALKRE
eukprot:6190450-Pleurochrysis_carterae.AAC.2